MEGKGYHLCGMVEKDTAVRVWMGNDTACGVLGGKDIACVEYEGFRILPLWNGGKDTACVVWRGNDTASVLLREDTTCVLLREITLPVWYSRGGY